MNKFLKIKALFLIYTQLKVQNYWIILLKSSDNNLFMYVDNEVHVCAKPQEGLHWM